MKIEVLSIGSFPEATNAELANRFTVTRYLRQPVADALGANLKNRIRAIATEANHGALARWAQGHAHQCRPRQRG